MHLVDSSTLYSILLGESEGSWAHATLNRLRPLGGVFINQIVFSESAPLLNPNRKPALFLLPSWREWICLGSVR
jgi:hypothetical protein